MLTSSATTRRQGIAGQSSQPPSLLRKKPFPHARQPTPPKERAHAFEPMHRPGIAHGDVAAVPSIAPGDEHQSPAGQLSQLELRSTVASAQLDAQATRPTTLNAPSASTPHTVQAAEPASAAVPAGHGAHVASWPESGCAVPGAHGTEDTPLAPRPYPGSSAELEHAAAEVAPRALKGVLAAQAVQAKLDAASE
jgi:hypothetical protein